MRFYTTPHTCYGGIDLHTKNMDVCMLDAAGEIRFHRHITPDREPFLPVIAPFCQDMIIAVACLCTWYGIADLCAEEDLPVVLDPALSRKAIYDRKSKSDTLLPRKLPLYSGVACFLTPLSLLLRCGPREISSDVVTTSGESGQHGMLLCRTHAVSIIGLITWAASLNLSTGKAWSKDAKPSIQKHIAVDLDTLEASDRLLSQLACDIIKIVKEHDLLSYSLLQTIPGVGKILALVMLYAIENRNRFLRVQDVVSSCHLVKCAKESPGKQDSSRGKKSGTGHRKWAFPD